VPLPLFFYRKHGKNLTKDQNKLYKTRTKILRKFSEKKNKIKDLNINCVIPVRGPNIDKFCNSLELLKKKYLIFHTIDEALKIKELKKIILTTSDLKLIKIVKKKYKNNIFYHKRKKKLSQQNINFKESVMNAVKKFNKKKLDILVIMTLENPFRKSFYIQQAISNLIIHDSDMVIGTVPDIENTYYKYSKKGIELISNEKNQKLKLEKNIILKDVGAFSVQKYKSYLRNSINKITNVVLDHKDSILINSKSDLILARKIF
jgi:CMP-N-acetylneuraminic acid synthetase